MIKKIGLVLVIIFLLSSLCVGVAAAKAKATATPSPTVTVSPTPTPTVELKTQKDKLSYSLGMDIAKTFKNQEIDVDVNILAKGLADGLSGANSLLTEEEIAKAFETLQNEMNAKNAERKAKLGVQNQKDSDAFFAENKTKEGVVTLPSGLQYKELTAGTGAKPTAADTVVVNYRCTLLDGTEVDSSYKRGQTATFGLTDIIPGWSEALQLMKVGAKWQLFLPPNLAYGENGAGSAIGPNQALIFEVELVSIEAKK